MESEELKCWPEALESVSVWTHDKRVEWLKSVNSGLVSSLAIGRQHAFDVDVWNTAVSFGFTELK